MKENFILIIKGIIVGLGKIIPGVSGAMLAITLGIYDKCINAFSNFTKNMKYNINLLFFVGLGIIISVGIFSNVVIYLLDKQYLLTMCLFIGLIIGGCPKIFSESKVDVKKISNIVIILISFLLVTMTNYLTPNNVIKMNGSFFTLIFVGFVEAFAMIVPGISGTALLMMMGYYDLVLLRFSQMFNIMAINETIIFFLPFGLGMLIGVLVMSKIISIMFKKFPIKTYCIIIGLILSSIYILLKDLFIINLNLLSFMLGIVFIFIGMFISYKLDKILNK